MVNRTRVYLAVLITVLVLCIISQTVIAASQHRLSKKELKALIASAKTPEDHQEVADYYHAEAKRLRADAKEHKQWAEIYAKGPTGKSQEQAMTGGAPAATHCQKWADLENQEADEADALAVQHEDMAKAAH